MMLGRLCGPQRQNGYVSGVQGTRPEMQAAEQRCVACADAEQWSFLLLAAPEPLVGAASTPVVPVAVL